MNLDWNTLLQSLVWSMSSRGDKTHPCGEPVEHNSVSDSFINASPLRQEINSPTYGSKINVWYLARTCGCIQVKADEKSAMHRQTRIFLPSRCLTSRFSSVATASSTHLLGWLGKLQWISQWHVIERKLVFHNTLKTNGAMFYDLVLRYVCHTFAQWHHKLTWNEVRVTKRLSGVVPQFTSLILSVDDLKPQVSLCCPSLFGKLKKKRFIVFLNCLQPFEPLQCFETAEHNEVSCPAFLKVNDNISIFFMAGWTKNSY